MPLRPSRISGACNGCRAKKQKCSGDRNGCAQCATAGIACTWPEQRKRGPAKGYIEALEQRLHAAESLLLAMLPRVDDNILQEATAGVLRRGSRAESDVSTTDVDEQQANRSSPPALNKKTGVEYWENFPLDSPSHIRRWQQDCEIQSSSHSSTERSRAQSHSKSSNSLRQQLRGDDDMRSSVTAATTIAGMRHSGSSPGTPGSTSTSSMMAVSAGSRPIYETAMSPGRSMSQSSMSSAMQAHLPRQQPQPQQQQQHHVPHHQHQSSLWYQQYPQQTHGGQQNINVGIDMNVDQAYAHGWSNNHGDAAMQVDAATMAPGVAPGVPVSRSDPQVGAPGSLYQGDFSQNIFW